MSSKLDSVSPFHRVLGQLRSRQSVGLCFLLCCPVLLSSGQPVFVVSHSALHEVYACRSCSWFSARHRMAGQQVVPFRGDDSRSLTDVFGLLASFIINFSFSNMFKIKI